MGLRTVIRREIMKRLWIVILFFLSSCNLCLFGDQCLGPYEGLYFTFRYADSNGNDLLYGATQKYDVTDIRIYAFDSSNDKIFAKLSTYKGISTVDVSLPYIIERSFLEVDGTVTDTLDFSFTSRTDKCCGTSFRIETAAVNGTPYLDDQPMVIIERN